MTAKYKYGISGHYGSAVCLYCGRTINFSGHSYFRRHSSLPGSGKVCPGSGLTLSRQKDLRRFETMTKELLGPSFEEQFYCDKDSDHEFDTDELGDFCIRCGERRNT